ncbi:uncharacterized protein LOC142543523 isoform X1 [Primulina tabacum]|uniref:uncharacterized protein LOC142543523 isoform X1 n=2 Tax=Primulina tabacum TaxID=48773 RepID=UPI003F5A2658
MIEHHLGAGMGTKVQCKSFLPGYYSMRDLNEDSSSSSWPLFYGDNTPTNGQYFNGFIPRTTIDDHSGYEKDAMKQKMLEHETVFRNQVHELHRLYRIQRDMMEEVKRKELYQRASIEPSSSSSLLGSQKPSEDARKWHVGGFPMTNSTNGRTTILGVEVANSPMSSTIGNDTQPSLFPLKNGSSSKDREGLDPRPLKVRKKLFDLHRPAEEYADTEEGGNFEDNSTSPKSSVKLILDNQAGVKVPINASASDCRFRGSIGFADLNEPFQYEELVTPSHFDFHGRHSTNGDTKRMNQSAKSNAGHLGAIHDGFLLNSPIGNKVNERDRFSSFYEAGYDKSNLNSMSQALRQDKFPRLNQVNHPSGLYPSVCSRQDLWRDNPLHGAEFLEKSRDLSHTFFSSPSFTGSRTHSASSLAKSKNDFTQKSTTFEPPFNSTAAVDRSFQPFSQTRDAPLFGGKWRVDASSRLNPGLESEGKVINGFYHGSASGFKETQALLSSAGFDYLKYNKDDKIVSDPSTNHGFGIFAKRKSCHEDSKPALDINLNEVGSTSPNELVILEDLNMAHGKIKPEYHLPALPWLRPKPANDNKRCSNYVPDLSNKLCHSRETVGDLNQPITTTDMLAPNNCRVIEKNLNAETRNVQKILGFPIFPTIDPKEEPTFLVSSSTIVNYTAEKNIVSAKRVNRIIDINIECEPDEQIADEELTVEKPTKNTCFIDLNSCVGDCEDPPVPSFETKNNSVKVTLEIDLEAPVLLESEDDDAEAKKNVPEDVSFPVSENNAEPIHDEVLQNAADAMLAISSSCPRVDISEDSLAESLLWFVNAMSLCSVELEHLSGKESRAGDAFPQQEFSKETDDFEAMVLQLMETKKEAFMPKPFIPKVCIEENEGTTNMLATRSRRGHSRRGRQRKDFQRDILPGLTSLSRHAITEDLQTFGGIMKATGHQWNSGLARRNGTRNSGGARGRRRVVVETVTTTVPSTVCAPLMPQPDDIKFGLEDRSLAGWGKTTRRPRRQRFPAGNTPTIAST